MIESVKGSAHATDIFATDDGRGGRPALVCVIKWACCCVRLSLRLAHIQRQPFSIKQLRASMNVLCISVEALWNVVSQLSAGDP